MTGCTQPGPDAADRDHPGILQDQWLATVPALEAWAQTRLGLLSADSIHVLDRGIGHLIPALDPRIVIAAANAVLAARASPTGCSVQEKYLSCPPDSGAVPTDGHETPGRPPYLSPPAQPARTHWPLSAPDNRDAARSTRAQQSGAPGLSRRHRPPAS
jgi:hypothetical protein